MLTIGHCGIDTGKKIEIHVSVLHLRTYKENADFSEANTHYVKGSKTLSSYNANVYTDDFIKFTSEDAKNSTKKLNLYCAPDGFTRVISREAILRNPKRT
jgi:hypothetical protein